MRMVMEVGPCDGDLAYARQLVDVLARFPGVQMKAQFYTADTIVRPGVKRYDHTSGGGDTQHEIFQRQLSWDQWAGVKRYADEKGVMFFPSVFSLEAVDAAVEMGCDTLKIASGDITYRQLIEEAARKARRLVISTGASTIDEVGRAVAWAQKGSVKDLYVLACHLEYPSRDEDLRLGRMVALGRYFSRSSAPVQIGYSDHTRRTDHTVVLEAMGCAMWEKHFTLKPRAGGDHDFALTPEGLEVVVSNHQMIYGMLGEVELEPTAGEQAARLGARRSLVAARTLKRGEKIRVGDLVALRPGGGIEPHEEERILKERMVAMVDIEEGTMVEWRMIGNVGATLTVE